MTGDFMGPEEAHRIGLYNRLADDVLAEATALAEKLAKGPSYALEVTKNAIRREADMELHTALDAEAEAQAVCMLNPNFKEAYHAFVEKREADFI